MASPAYDFERFAPRQAPVVSRPELRVVKHKKKENSSAKAHPVRSVLCCAAVVIVFFAVMFSRAQYTELFTEVAETAATLEELKSEETRLNLGIEGMVSMRRVEEYAQNELGLIKAEGYQTTYMTLSEEDKVEVSTENESVIDLFARTITGFVNGN